MDEKKRENVGIKSGRPVAMHT